MTAEQKEAIKICTHYKNILYACNCEEGTERTGKAIETVLSMLQEQQEENKKKDKIIDEMARFITNKDIDEDICRYQVVEHCKDEEYGVTTNVCINCIKQYFERKRNEL